MLWLGVAIRSFEFLGLNSLEWVGFLWASVLTSYFGYEIINVIYNTWIGQFLGDNADLKGMGKWAVITGATDEIGKAYVEELAKLGIDVVLISRSLDKLKKLKEDIEAEFKVDVKIIAVDFTQGLQVYETIRKELDGLEIGTLVNNVGMTYPYPEYFLDLPNGDKLCKDMIYCNLVSLTMMIRIVMPQMVKRGRGVVVNVGSFSAVIPVSLMTVYGASKAFMDKLSWDLCTEYADKGIIVQGLLPGYIATKLSPVGKSLYSAPSPTEYTKVALKTIGLQNRTAAYLPHRAWLYAFGWGNFFFRDFFAQRFYHISQKTWLKANRSQARRAQGE